MDESNLIEIDGESFELLDQLDSIPIVDSFVKKNKIGSGHGEAKLYLGPENDHDYNNLFDNFVPKAFFLRDDFERYLDDAKFEYEEQEQGYIKDISADWNKYRKQVGKLHSRVFFSIFSKVSKGRYYINSRDDFYREFFRNVMLPLISYVSILKLKSANGDVHFLFRPTLNYSYNPYYHPAKAKKVERGIKRSARSEEDKLQLVKARLGQGVYRAKLMEESSECIVTRVNDERILIAGHIKPWSVCSDLEKIDHNNGLALTPTYDRLFDQGFISFQDDGTILLSPYISPLNLKKLNLSKGRRYDIPSSEKRLTYLNYHREKIYKGG